MNCESASVLVIGYGNPGRVDDGLGPALAAELEERALPGVDVESNYQLVVEDAPEVAKHDVVIFVDAAAEGAEPFCFTRLEPVQRLGFSSHGETAQSLLGLARSLFGARTEAYALGIRGYEFNRFGEQLSPKAESNKRRALEFIIKLLEEANFSEEADRPRAAEGTKCEKASQ